MLQPGLFNPATPITTHPSKGGWYKEMYKSSEMIPKSGLSLHVLLAKRVFSTAIYFFIGTGVIF
jgi:predicted cupin superfamily sugar epimerase